MGPVAFLSEEFTFAGGEDMPAVAKAVCSAPPDGLSVVWSSRVHDILDRDSVGVERAPTSDTSKDSNSASQSHEWFWSPGGCWVAGQGCCG